MSDLAAEQADEGDGFDVPFEDPVSFSRDTFAGLDNYRDNPDLSAADVAETKQQLGELEQSAYESEWDEPFEAGPTAPQLSRPSGMR
jgi:hypothetical protein